MTSVAGGDICADMETQHLDFQTMHRHMKFCGVRFVEGRGRIAPQLE